MSADTTSAEKPAEKPLITLLNTPSDETEPGERPASQCCGGGSCSL